MPEDARLLVLRGRALETIGRRNEAQAVFSSAFALQPEDLLIRVHALPRVSRTEAYALRLADLRAFLREHPQQPAGSRLALAGLHLQWGSQQWKAGRRQEAETALVQAAEMAPQNAQLLFQRGEVWFSLDENDKAIADYSLALELVQHAPWKALLYRQRGFAQSRLGHYAETLADWERALEAAPDNALALNDLAWLLATCADAALRDPKRAIELAAKAVELAPKEGMFWNTLGAVRYRAGDWPAAVEALNKSMELRGGGDSADWFFLALAEWQRGNKDKARDWYDKAVEWMQKNARDNEELKRFSAEARELLGIRDP
jgi:tetratricopeptide (TPR) repeat protein